MYTEMPIMPLNAVLFPGMPLPLFIFEARYREMISQCLEEQMPFGVALIREGVEAGGPAIPWEIGTTAHIVETAEGQDGGLHLLTAGGQRFRLDGFVRTEPFLVADVALLPEGEDEATPVEVRDELRELFREHLRLLVQFLEQPETEFNLPDSAARLSYMVAAHLTCVPVARQRLLEMDSVAERLFHEKHMLQKESNEYRLLLAARKRYDALGVRVEDEVFSLN